MKKLFLIILGFAGFLATETSSTATQINLVSAEALLTQVINPVTYELEDRGNFLVTVDIFADTTDLYVRKAYAIKYGDFTFSLRLGGSEISPTMSTFMSPFNVMAGDTPLWFYIPDGSAREFQFSLDELIPQTTGTYDWSVDMIKVATTMDVSTLAQVNLGSGFQTPDLYLNAAQVPEPGAKFYLSWGIACFFAFMRRR